MKRFGWNLIIDLCRYKLSHQGIDRVLIFLYQYPTNKVLWQGMKILIPGQIGFRSGITCKYNRHVVYSISKPRPWLITESIFNNQPTLVSTSIGQVFNLPLGIYRVSNIIYICNQTRPEGDICKGYLTKSKHISCWHQIYILCLGFFVFCLHVYFLYLLHFLHTFFCFYNFHSIKASTKHWSYECPLLTSGSFKEIISC